MKTCAFCKIVRGEAPADRLYEDDLVLAFLHVAPLNRGHALVIPKVHHTSITTVSADAVGRMMDVGARLGIAIRRAVDGDGFNLLLANGACAGQIVPHAHLHVIPRHAEDGLVMPYRNVGYDGDEQRRTIAEAVMERLRT